MTGAVSTRDFGTREDEPITDLETAGPGATRDTHTAMGLFKGMVQRLGEVIDELAVVSGLMAEKDTWSYAPAAVIADTADVTIAPAPSATGERNYLTGLQFLNTDATAPTELVVKSGATVIWRGFAQHTVAAVTQPGMTSIVFSGRGLRQPQANTALTVACITTSSQTYVNAQGYVGL
jgi:hypothetical protein